MQLSDKSMLSVILSIYCTIYTCRFLFRSVPLSIVTHTGIYKQRNGTEQEAPYIGSLIINNFDMWVFHTIPSVRGSLHYQYIVCFIWAATWENRIFSYAKTKTQISFAVTAKLFSVFVFATRIVQSIFFLNPKFQVSSYFYWLSSPVCRGPGQNHRRPVFWRRGSFNNQCECRAFLGGRVFMWTEQPT